MHRDPGKNVKSESGSTGQQRQESTVNLSRYSSSIPEHMSACLSVIPHALKRPANRPPPPVTQGARPTGRLGARIPLPTAIPQVTSFAAALRANCLSRMLRLASHGLPTVTPHGSLRSHLHTSSFCSVATHAATCGGPMPHHQHHARCFMASLPRHSSTTPCAGSRAATMPKQTCPVAQKTGSSGGRHPRAAHISAANASWCHLAAAASCP